LQLDRNRYDTLCGTGAFRLHLQQTKRGSRGSGGPQYYFHDLTDEIKTFLRDRGAVRVALVTPYGATLSDYRAVSLDKKLSADHKPIPGNVGHDRIQQGAAKESIGEAIRDWYRLKTGDFERIDVDLQAREGVFYLTPLSFKYADKPETMRIMRIERPLTFTKQYESEFWVNQLVKINRRNPGLVHWALNEIGRVVTDHLPKSKLEHVMEPDLLRASGPLRHLGVTLGGFRGKGFDCDTTFDFNNYPTYNVWVEIKRNSSGYRYQEHKYTTEKLSRVVVLCAVHNHTEMPDHVDVIELNALSNYMNRLPLTIRA
jgi:hypothetical protein